MRKVLYIFGILTDADIEWMALVGLRRRLKEGDVIISEGKASDFLVFLLEGELAVSTAALGQIARLGVGEVVGEMSLVDSAPPSATIVAKGDGLALFIDKVSLKHKLESDDGFAARFYRALAIFLADRLRDARRSKAAKLMLSDESAIAEDELDIGMLDSVSAAGERFSRMLRILSANHPN
jgi:CRP/FNR family transcriptional regulator, cyclic AMP receptor protein